MDPNPNRRQEIHVTGTIAVLQSEQSSSILPQWKWFIKFGYRWCDVVDHDPTTDGTAGLAVVVKGLHHNHAVHSLTS